MPATQNNERLEYLGDAVLELSISHLLMKRFPDHSEGELSKMRAAIVNEEQLAALAASIDLGGFLRLGKGEDGTGGREKPSILSDAFEAILGAIYLDSHFDSANKVIEKLYQDVLTDTGEVGFWKDYKTELQEVSQSRFKAIPRYNLEGSSGPDHRKIFQVALSIKGETVSIGSGTSKKSAEQDAARKALTEMGET